MHANTLRTEFSLAIQLQRFSIQKFPITADFATILGQANKRDEICLGVRYGDLEKDASQNFGVALNLEKDKMVTLNENDFLVVLAEDEL